MDVTAPLDTVATVNHSKQRLAEVYTRFSIYIGTGRRGRNIIV
jgi:hypothetical protein